MDFSVASVILWPKDSDKSIRRIDFERGKINIITGGSEKGKSAVIAIIDYCLGSGICRIPTNVIRNLTAWFGVLVDLSDGNQILIARKEPGDALSSGEMYMKEGRSLTIPPLVQPNYHLNDVKTRLDNIAELSSLNLSGDENTSGLDSRPSFRDLTSFLFQPQHIIANQSTLFYRADSLPHREKLKNIFPYLYKAVDNKYLELQAELKAIERRLSLLEREYERKRQYMTKWLGQLRGYYQKAKEFGLLASLPEVSDDWKNEQLVDILREVSTEVNSNKIPSVNLGNVVSINNRIAQLTTIEVETAYKLHLLKHRLELVTKLSSSNREYRTNLLAQENRLKLSTWFNDLLKKGDDKCPFCGKKSAEASVYITDLLQAKNEIVITGTKLNDNYSVLNGETRKLKGEIEELIKTINNTRREIEILQVNSKSQNNELNTLNAMHQFAGKLDAEIGNYDSLTEEKDLETEITILNNRKSIIIKEVNDEVIKSKIDRARRLISDGIKHYAQIFEAENSKEIIEFNDRDLTINFISSSGRRDALYEIGSGHNYMSYHLSTLLSLHEFFISQESHPVPNFIVFDQPTQVYFPEKSDRENAEKSDDEERVKRIFKALSAAIDRTQGKLQIIVLEHVGDYAWTDFKHIKKIKRWRIGENDDALIPEDWM